MKRPIHRQFEGIFASDPKRGAEYFGDITRFSIWFNVPEEAAARARLAARLGMKAIREAKRKGRAA